MLQKQKVYFSIRNLINNKIYCGYTSHPDEYIDRIIADAQLYKGENPKVGEALHDLEYDLYHFPITDFKIRLHKEQPAYKLHKYKYAPSIETLTASELSYLSSCL